MNGTTLSTECNVIKCSIITYRWCYYVNFNGKITVIRRCTSLVGQHSKGSRYWASTPHLKVASASYLFSIQSTTKSNACNCGVRWFEIGYQLIYQTILKLLIYTPFVHYCWWLNKQNKHLDSIRKYIPNSIYWSSWFIRYGIKIMITSIVSNQIYLCNCRDAICRYLVYLNKRKKGCVINEYIWMMTIALRTIISYSINYLWYVHNKLIYPSYVLEYLLQP